MKLRLLWLTGGKDLGEGVGGRREVDYCANRWGFTLARSNWVPGENGSAQASLSVLVDKRNYFGDLRVIWRTLTRRHWTILLLVTFGQLKALHTTRPLHRPLHRPAFYQFYQLLIKKGFAHVMDGWIENLRCFNGSFPSLLLFLSYRATSVRC